MKAREDKTIAPPAPPAAPAAASARMLAPALRNMGILIVALGVLGGAWYWRQPVKEGRPPEREMTRRFKSDPGPWGDLEYVPIVLETPDEFLSVTRQANYQSLWTFQHFSPAQLHSLFRGAGLAPEEEAWLQDEHHWQASTNGVVVSPPPELVQSLNRSAREKIYNTLAQCGGNALHEMPMTHRLAGFDDWFKHSGLSPNTIAMTKSLLYQRGNAWCLSDWPVLLRQIESPAEQHRLLKTVSRQSTLLGRIRVHRDTDVEKLVSYWGRGGRSKDIRALLESLTRVEDGATLDIVHLLPRFARARLYTYPFPANSPSTRTPNCFWTSMNFFSNQNPTDRFHDPETMLKVLEKDYFPVEESYLLGDVLLLSKPDGSLVHAAVFIADDVVLTKNGAHHTQPWMLAQMDDLAASYPSVTPLKMRAFRRKDL